MFQKFQTCNKASRESTKGPTKIADSSINRIRFSIIFSPAIIKLQKPIPDLQTVDGMHKVKRKQKLLRTNNHKQILND